MHTLRKPSLVPLLLYHQQFLKKGQISQNFVLILARSGPCLRTVHTYVLFSASPSNGSKPNPNPKLKPF